MLKLLLLPLIANVLLASCDANKNGSYVESLYSQLNYASLRLMFQFMNHEVKVRSYQTFATSPLQALILAGEMALHTDGNLHKDMLQLLNLDNKSQIEDVFNYAMSMYNTEDGVKSTLKSKVYGDCGISFSNKFTKEFHEIFEGDTENIDALQPDKAADTINKWVHNQSSNNKSQDVISAHEIKRDSGLYVMSTHEFVVVWSDEFSPQGITEIDFNVNNNQVIRMPSLEGDGYLNYVASQQLDCQIIDLPTKSKEYIVRILLPNKVEGLPVLLQQLENPDLFIEADNSMRKSCVDFNVPLGEVHTTVDIKTNLIAENYGALFNYRTANLKSISKGNNNNLYISQCKDSISIIGNSEVGNTDGTDGSDSSNHSDVCNGKNKKLVKCDRPFIYMIIRKKVTPIIGGAYYGNT